MQFLRYLTADFDFYRVLHILNFLVITNDSWCMSGFESCPLQCFVTRNLFLIPLWIHSRTGNSFSNHQRIGHSLDFSWSAYVLWLLDCMALKVWGSCFMRSIISGICRYSAFFIGCTFVLCSRLVIAASNTELNMTCSDDDWTGSKHSLKLPYCLNKSEAKRS